MRDFQFPSRSVVMGREAAAATSHPLATLTAIDILKAGGNAVDAAIAAGAVLTVVEPQMTSLGGDCFAIVHDPDSGLHCLNGSGCTANTLDVDALRASGMTDIPADSVHAVTAPGSVAAWNYLLATFGRLGLDQVLQPAIDHAERGTPVAPRVAFDWAKHPIDLARDAGTSQHYLVNGRAPIEGDIMAYPALAGTLRELADKGPDGLYKGWVADDLIAMLQTDGSALTHDDFAAVEAVPVKPIVRRYREFDVLGFPPNTQGLAILLILGMLDRFGPWAGDPLDPQRLHIYLEAVRRGYAVRNRHLADPDFMEMTPEALVSDDTIDRLAATIDPARATAFDAVPDLTGTHTVYLTVVDGDGRAVSFINSLFGNFGAKRTGPKSGVLMQNRGHGFNLVDGHPNCIAPGKRPLHTLIPGMVLADGLPLYCYGVMGGAYQAAGHAYVLSNLIDYGFDPQAALDLPRVFMDDVFAPHQTAVTAESRIPASALSALSDRGHHVIDTPGPIGCGQAIRIDKSRGVLIAGSDPRKDGLALAY